MDITSVDALLGALPQAGVGGIVLWMLVLLMRRESAAQDRFTAEYARISEAHNEEIRELQEQIQALRMQIEDLQVKLDQEREERRKAQDEAAEYRRSTKGF